MNPVVHFEMPYDDPGRMGKFYKDAFGWKTKALGEKMGNYVTAATSESAPGGAPTKPGRINGGFYQRKPEWPEQHPSVVIAVDDIEKSIAKVTSAGGRVLGEPMDIPGIGAYVSFMDTEGNRVSMLQPSPDMAKEKKKPAAKKAAAKTKGKSRR
jgi:uncharacterized protein